MPMFTSAGRNATKCPLWHDISDQRRNPIQTNFLYFNACLFPLHGQTVWPIWMTICTGVDHIMEKNIGYFKSRYSHGKRTYACETARLSNIFTRLYAFNRGKTRDPYKLAWLSVCLSVLWRSFLVKENAFDKCRECRAYLVLW